MYHWLETLLPLIIHSQQCPPCYLLAYLLDLRYYYLGPTYCQPCYMAPSSTRSPSFPLHGSPPDLCRPSSPSAHVDSWDGRQRRPIRHIFLPLPLARCAAFLIAHGTANINYIIYIQCILYISLKSSFYIFAEARLEVRSPRFFLHP